MDAAEIAHKEFVTTWKGYDRDEVRRFLALVAAAVAERDAELARLWARLGGEGPRGEGDAGSGPAGSGAPGEPRTGGPGALPALGTLADLLSRADGAVAAARAAARELERARAELLAVVEEVVTEHGGDRAPRILAELRSRLAGPGRTGTPEGPGA